MVQERVVKGLPGGLMVGVLIAGAIGALALLANSNQVQETPWLIAAIAIGLTFDAACWVGLTVVNPNTAKVLLLFGDYKGTIKAPGFCWVNPLTVRRTVSHARSRCLAKRSRLPRRSRCQIGAWLQTMIPARSSLSSSRSLSR